MLTDLCCINRLYFINRYFSFIKLQQLSRLLQLFGCQINWFYGGTRIRCSALTKINLIYWVKRVVDDFLIPAIWVYSLIWILRTNSSLSRSEFITIMSDDWLQYSENCKFTGILMGWIIKPVDKTGETKLAQCVVDSVEHISNSLRLLCI